MQFLLPILFQLQCHTLHRKWPYISPSLCSTVCIASRSSPSVHCVDDRLNTAFSVDLAGLGGNARKLESVSFYSAQGEDEELRMDVG